MVVEGPLQNIPIVHYPDPPLVEERDRSRRSCGPDIQASNQQSVPEGESEIMRKDIPLNWKKYLIPLTKSSQVDSNSKTTPSNGESGANGEMAQSIHMDKQRSNPKDSAAETLWGERRKRFVRSRTNPELMFSKSQSKINEYSSEDQKDSGTPGFRGKFLQSLHANASQNSTDYNRRRYGASRGESTEGSQDEVETSAGNHRSNLERRNRYRRKAENKSHTSGVFGGGENANSEAPRGDIQASSSNEGGNRIYRVFLQPRVDYLEKGRIRRKFGTKGSADGQFNWPRGVALIPTSEEIAVCDSSNHRVQIFDRRGQFCRSFGGYGSGRAEFDCLAGIAVNKFHQFVVTDRYNHRLQIFDSNGRFIREFGSHGQANGRFNNPWGVVVDNQGFIYVCDKDNHRVQMFQADGNFVGKFGGIGSREGQFQNPHFIAVNRQNQLFVTDSSNHRVQVFDHNGHYIFSFGSEGFNEGQFKYPRGIAVDDQGFVVVADSGNNRIQVFYPDGRFYAEFGSWGPGEGQMKGVEGVAVSMEGHIIVSDRENHRIQVF